MTDVQPLLDAREKLATDFFGGWLPSDVALLERYRPEQTFQENVGELVDWLGIRTDLGNHAWLSVPSSGFVHVLGLPIPSDQVHAETIEYVALLIALERALDGGGSDFTVVELGASYAPWAVAAGVLAKRQGFSKVNLVAVEASERAVGKILEHAVLNGLTAEEGASLRAVHAAVHVDDAPVYFPRCDVSSDNGAQLSTAKGLRDYRGLAVEYDEVDGISFTTLCQDLRRIEFCHLDLQGAEERLLNDAEFLDTVDEKVGTLFLATQSRLIEGVALRAFARMGWRLVRERPTTYQQNDRTSDVNGYTTRDGGQVWLNPRFGSKHLDI